MSEYTNYKCDDCGSKNLLLPSWKTQDETGYTTSKQDFPDAFDLDGDAWCQNCVSIVFIDTNQEEEK